MLLTRIRALPWTAIFLTLFVSGSVILAVSRMRDLTQARQRARICHEVQGLQTELRSYEVLVREISTHGFLLELIETTALQPRREAQRLSARALLPTFKGDIPSPELQQALADTHCPASSSAPTPSALDRLTPRVPEFGSVFTRLRIESQKAIEDKQTLAQATRREFEHDIATVCRQLSSVRKTQEILTATQNADCSSKRRRPASRCGAVSPAFQRQVEELTELEATNRRKFVEKWGEPRYTRLECASALPPGKSK